VTSSLCPAEDAVPSPPPSPLAATAVDGAGRGSSVSMGVLGGTGGMEMPWAAAAVEAGATVAAGGEAAAAGEVDSGPPRAQAAVALAAARCDLAAKVLR